MCLWDLWRAIVITSSIITKAETPADINMSSLQKSILKSKLPPSGVNFGIGSRLVADRLCKSDVFNDISRGLSSS